VVGQFKDDQIQDHKHNVTGNPVPRGSGANLVEINTTTSNKYATTTTINARAGDTTHGKQKGVKYIIKVL